MKNYILLLLAVFSLSSCISFTNLISSSDFSKKDNPIGMTMKEFEDNNPKPTMKNQYFEGDIKVVELCYVESVGVHRFINSVFRFENDLLVSQDQISEIREPAPVIQCDKH